MLTERALLVLEEPGKDGLGMDAGKGWIADDFDAPLPEDLQLFFEGRS